MDNFYQEKDTMRHHAIYRIGRVPDENKIPYVNDWKSLCSFDMNWLISSIRKIWMLLKKKDKTQIYQTHFRYQLINWLENIKKNQQQSYP